MNVSRAEKQNLMEIPPPHSVLINYFFSLATPPIHPSFNTLSLFFFSFAQSLAKLNDNLKRGRRGENKQGRTL